MTRSIGKQGVGREGASWLISDDPSMVLLSRQLGPGQGCDK